MLTSQAAPTPIAITPSPTPAASSAVLDEVVPEHGLGEMRPDARRLGTSTLANTTSTGSATASASASASRLQRSGSHGPRGAAPARASFNGSEIRIVARRAVSPFPPRQIEAAAERRKLSSQQPALLSRRQSSPARRYDTMSLIRIILNKNCAVADERSGNRRRRLAAGGRASPRPTALGHRRAAGARRAGSADEQRAGPRADGAGSGRLPATTAGR